MSNKKAKKKLIRKILRHERYLLEKENSRKYLHYGYEDELYQLSPFGIYSEMKAKQEKAYKKLLFQAMYLAMDDLEKLNPYWHKLICEFYLRKDEITLAQLGAMHGISRQAVTKSFKRAMKVVQQLAEEYLEHLMQ